MFALPLTSSVQTTKDADESTLFPHYNILYLSSGSGSDRVNGVKCRGQHGLFGTIPFTRR